MLKLTGTETALAIVIGVGGAVLGYVLSEADRRKLGRTPWGLPSPVWALLWFIHWLLGSVLFLFAHRSEVRRAAQGTVPPVDVSGGPLAASTPKRSIGSDFPAYPRPAGGGDRPPPAAAPPPPPTPPAAAASTPPSWQPDPSGRYHYRWWTGTEWTSYVSTHGQVVVDTSPDQRIGPYGQG